jgi:ABC-2 type transport system permease protein
MLNSLQYRASAIAGIITQLFWGFMLLMIYEAFYNSSTVQEFTYTSLASYIWLKQAFFTFFSIYADDPELGNIIMSGNVAYELLRPYSMYTFWFSKSLGTRLSSGLLAAPLVLVIAFILPAPYNLSLPANCIALVLSIISLTLGVFLITSILMMAYLSMFKTHNKAGTFILFAIIIDLLGGHYIPIPLMPKWLQTICNFLPFRYASDLPLRIYTGDIVGNEMILGISIEIFWLVLLFMIGSYLMRRATKKVAIFGG